MIYWIILDSLRASISLPIEAPTNVSVFCMAALFRQLRLNYFPPQPLFGGANMQQARLFYNNCCATHHR